MKKIIKVVQSDLAPFNLTWVINNICPNRCSYCPSSLHLGTNHNYDWENARRFFTDLFKRYPKIHCSVAGGEPSMSPFLEELIQIFKDNDSTIGLTSNAAKPASFWDRVSPDLNYICFSWHAEFIDKNFRAKVEAAMMNTSVTIRIMMNTQHWERSVEEYLFWKDNPYVLVEPVKALNWNSSSVDPKAYTYTPEQERWFESNIVVGKFKSHLKARKFLDLGATFHFDDGTEVKDPNVVTLINNGQTNFYGYKCEVGLKEMFIDWRGLVYLSNCQIGGVIGNINEPDDIQWPSGPVICNKNICHCTSDVVINKWIE
jgi:MoaA/NifB/PqqE/SkfB family radical SAM enzyme